MASGGLNLSLTCKLIEPAMTSLRMASMALMSRIEMYANEMYGPYEKHHKVSFSYYFICDIIMHVLVTFLQMGTPCDAYHKEHESQCALMDI